jgi:fimbrial chaperone protein
MKDYPMRLTRHLHFLSLFASPMAFAPAHAASSVVIWPIDPAMTAQDKATPLWIENRGTEPVTFQVRAYRWTQADGENLHEAQTDVIASPPVAQVAPGARQLIRLIKIKDASQGSESAYRLLIDELPRAPAPGATAAPRADLEVQMRYSIPLFVRGASVEGAGYGPALKTAFVLDGGQRYVELRNTGAMHARLTDLRLVTRGDEATIVKGLAGYVLPGATMRLALPTDAPVNATVRLGINGNDQLLTSGS